MLSGNKWQKQTEENLMHRGSRTSKNHYRKEIDGLRAIAVIAVIVNHFDKGLLPFGYLGVDIFFAISGFVIALSIYRSHDRFNSIKDFAKDFYSKRVLRLFPALFVMIIITGVAIVLFDPNPTESIWTGSLSFVGASNLYLNHLSTDYWSASTEMNPFTHTWSLGIEEQFYLVFPLLFCAYLRRSGTSPRSRNILLATIFSVIAISAATFFSTYKTNIPAAYFLPQFRAWELLSGVAIFLIFERTFGLNSRKQQRLRLSRPITEIAQISSLVLLIAALFSQSPTPLRNTLVAIIGTCLFLFFGHEDGISKKLLSTRIFTTIGLLSYSLYLWHWPVISLFKWTLGMTWRTIALQVILVVILATISYRFIETRLRQSAAHKLAITKHWKISAILLMASPVLAGISLSKLAKPAYGLANQNNNFKLEFEEKEWPGGIKIIYRVVKKSWFNDQMIHLRNFANCHRAGEINNTIGSECLLQQSYPSPEDTSARKTIKKNYFFILGDSHASNYAFGIGKALSNRFNVSQFTIGHGCSYISQKEAAKVVGTNCSSYTSIAEEIINQAISPGDIVALGMMHSHYDIEETKTIIHAFAKKITSMGGTFLLLDDLPDLADPIKCLKTWYRPNRPKNCLKGITEVDREFKTMDNFGERISLLPNAHYLRLRQHFCENNECSHEVDGQLIYFNKGHLTIQGSHSAAHLIKNTFDNFMNKI